MLACLPGPGDLPLQLLPHTQMNTGLQKWDTTQRMRSTPFPTPSELDAYAKKVANNPLTIKIFPNSVKVPQRNHVRRTVNGLDTSGQRYSPYPAQPSAKAGLLAIVKAPQVKGIVKDYDGSRARLHPDINAHGPYPVGPNSTLNHSLNHSLNPTLNPSLNPSLNHSLNHSVNPQTQALPRPHSLLSQDLPHSLQMALPQQMLRHAPSMAPHPQAPPRPPQPPPSALMLHQPHLQQQPGSRTLPDGDAPPNVTVSTSTIPLSMAPGLQQGRHGDLSAIVHQINQFCQARAHGGGASSMCEGQIANPSPISRNLLISACSRVSMHGAAGFAPNCVLGPADKVTALAPPSLSHLPSNRSDIKLHHLHPQQSQALHHGNGQAKLRPWSQHLGPVQNGAPLAKPREPGFHFKSLGYSNEVCAGQPYQLKPPIDRPTPSPPGPLLHYSNGHYFQPHVWNSGILPTPNSDSSGSQDVAMPFHGAGPGGCTALDCGPPGGPHYRLGAGSTSSSAHTNLMQTADYLGGDFQTPYFRDQNLGLMGKMHRPALSRVGPEVGDGRTALIQHPGYR